ncbi:unnamed protein product [Orchesella dallaii]|uniref:Tubby C-terminal domain-containing protein n=1 Tax=Orchesella dallaii TaxID=48710 RepID=A0ABP1R5Y3_9HEXA
MNRKLTTEILHFFADVIRREMQFSTFARQKSLRQVSGYLTLVLCQREETLSKYGPLFTYKLMLGGLHNRLEDFVLLSVPPSFNVKSRITRLKKGFVDRRLYPIYYMHLERDGPGDRKCLVLVAKKYKNLTGTGYILSTDPAELSTSSEYCVGRVESNFIGTEFILLSGRSVCTDVPPEKGALMAISKSDRFKEELASIIYVESYAFTPPNNR